MAADCKSALLGVRWFKSNLLHHSGFRIGVIYMMKLSNRCHQLLWVYIPIVFIVLWKLYELTFPYAVVIRSVSENGAVEAVQFLIMAAAFIFSLRNFLTAETTFMKVWFLCFTLGCLYIAGEEISWGQWIFYWETPELFLAINDQAETNLHNTSPWLDQKPRSVMELGVVVSGLILPFVAKRFPKKIPAWLSPLVPPKQAAVLACIYLLIKACDMIADSGFMPAPARL
jgi:hypothetical protein